MSTDTTTETRRQSRVESFLGLLAFVCAVASLPACVYLSLYYVSDFGLDALYCLLTQYDHPAVARALDHASFVGLVAALVSVTLSGGIAVRAAWRGCSREVHRIARWALRLGLFDLAIVLIPVLASILWFIFR